MKLRVRLVLGAIAILFSSFPIRGVTASSVQPPASSDAASPIRRCANDYAEEEIAEMVANGEDSYEPDDCLLLAHPLTGPMLFNFCQLGDEDWAKFPVRSGVIYQINTTTPSNYPTEPKLELYDDGRLIALNDHYFGKDAELWFWNDGPDRTLHVRASELRGRAECGNSEYTLWLKAYGERP
ncbi:MAG: hypothetical protein HY782_28445 [Chloroflexi bacterium]|nr:hypothetical protein [Chloroflexota bacterium]